MLCLSEGVFGNNVIICKCNAALNTMCDDVRVEGGVRRWDVGGLVHAV